jgi:hypothetical protein
VIICVKELSAAAAQGIDPWILEAALFTKTWGSFLDAEPTGPTKTYSLDEYFVLFYVLKNCFQDILKHVLALPHLYSDSALICLLCHLNLHLLGK